MSLSPVTPVRRPGENEISQTPGAPKKEANSTHHAVYPIPIGAPLGQRRTGAMWNQEKFDGRVIVTPWAWLNLDFSTSFEAGKKACEKKFRTELMSKEEFLEKRRLCYTVDEATYRIIKENERDGIIVAPKPLASSFVIVTLPSKILKKRSLDCSQDECKPLMKKAKTNVTTTNTTTTSTTSSKPVMKAVAESCKQDKNPFDELMEDAVKAIEAKHATKKLDNQKLASNNVDLISLVSESEGEDNEDEDGSLSPEICSSSAHINRCVECGVDMGNCNPRQYCGKTRCIADE